MSDEAGNFTIDEAQFRELVAGRSITLGWHGVILADIGFDRMAVALADAGAFKRAEVFDVALFSYKEAH